MRSDTVNRYNHVGETVEETEPMKYVFRLYVAGMTPRSTLAITNVRNICSRLLAGRYDLEVVDLYLDPARARYDQIIAIPTLVKASPSPLQRLIGDLSDRERVIKKLDLKWE